MFEPEVFREQMYFFEESTYDIVGTFRRLEHCTPLAPDRHPLKQRFLSRVREPIAGQWRNEVRWRPGLFALRSHSVPPY